MTSAGRWRTAFASVVGTSHEKTDSPCQDSAGCRVVELPNGEEVLIAAVSDGAGTAARSEIGSRLTVSKFLDDFENLAQRDDEPSLLNEQFLREWFQTLVVALENNASANGHEVRDYSCTFLGALITPSVSIYLQLGDGAIVVATEDRQNYCWIVWPQHGEYANSTYFVTQPGAENLLQIEFGLAVDEVAIFSDGLERLVLNMRERTVHAPAFRPIFEWLATTEADRSGLPSGVLDQYLGSEHINRRTDDDKSLVMATRRRTSELQDAEAPV